MNKITKWLGAVVAVALLAGTASAVETLIAGKVKSVNAESKEFTLTDAAGKESTFRFGDDVVINRGGKESASGLKADDLVSICYEKGTLSWKALYILVKEGDTKDYQLMSGTFKNYDADKKAFTYTDVNSKDWTFAMNGAKVRLNKQPSKIDEIKIGDTTLSIVEEIGDNRTLKDLMVTSKK